MTKNLRVAGLLLAPLVVAVGFMVRPGGGLAEEGQKTPREAILKVADAMARSDAEEAHKLAQALKDVDPEDIMPVFALRTPRNKRAVGVGTTPGAIKPDGIEKKLEALAARELPAGELAGQAEAIERAAYVAAAVGEIVHDKCPVETKQGNKDPKEWRTWCEDMVKGSQELAAAAKSRDAGRVKKAAERLDGTCKACHTPFK